MRARQVGAGDTEPRAFKDAETCKGTQGGSDSGKRDKETQSHREAGPGTRSS